MASRAIDPRGLPGDLLIARRMESRCLSCGRRVFPATAASEVPHLCDPCVAGRPKRPHFDRATHQREGLANLDCLTRSED